MFCVAIDDFGDEPVKVEQECQYIFSTDPFNSRVPESGNLIIFHQNIGSFNKEL